MFGGHFKQQNHPQKAQKFKQKQKQNMALNIQQKGDVCIL